MTIEKCEICREREREERQLKNLLKLQIPSLFALFKTTR